MLFSLVPVRQRTQTNKFKLVSDYDHGRGVYMLVYQCVCVCVCAYASLCVYPVLLSLCEGEGNAIHITTKLETGTIIKFGDVGVCVCECTCQGLC